jgi:hypothetical protein
MRRLPDPQQLHLLTDANLSALFNITVEGEFPIKTPDDVPQYRRVMVESIGVERRHDAPSPQTIHSDHHAAESKTPAGPCSLLEAFDSSDHEVWPQPPPVTAEGGNGAVRRHQKRQDIESIR